MPQHLMLPLLCPSLLSSESCARLQPQTSHWASPFRKFVSISTRLSPSSACVSFSWRAIPGDICLVGQAKA
ncbi:hypothetical protein L207DRAFT_506275 [Hyaloscypha variabilis F]|uniref:Secreted protein n=1 Tax=Hyaloscypha variabilis (strain UAMH 11265 / GT02V1 / F) TaxID=1149755 RepID=A0A2J6S932_HYAVF|nr:hypothetical protein L207DRAFT_506275 [Hyaloscypha variabilis F]